MQFPFLKGEGASAIFTRLINSCWSMFQWGLFLVVTAALLVGGYFYLRFDDEIRRHVQQLLASHYPNLTVKVGKARFEKGRGILVYDLTISDPRAAGPTQPTLSIDELFLACDTRVEELLSGKPRMDRIDVRRPRLHAIRQADGTWNLLSLLPLPRLSEQAPQLVIEDATLVLDDATRHDAARLTLRGIDINLSPMTDSAAATGTRADRRFHVVGTVAGCPARELKFNGTINADQSTGDLTLDVRGLEVTPELLAAIPGNSSTTSSNVQLYGKADATLRVWRSSAAPTDFGWSADVSLSRGRLEYAPLPQAVTDLAISLQADGQRLSIKELTGKFGTAEVAIAAERTGWSPDAKLGIHGKIVGLMADERLRAALPAALDRIWQRFQPAGPIDADVKLTFDGEHWRPELVAHCRGISLTDAEKFPYPVEQATGTVELLPVANRDDLELRLDLEARGNGQPIRIRADLANLKLPTAGEAASDEPQHKPVGWVEVAGSAITIHERLLAALSEKCQRFVRSLAPEGTVDFHWRYERLDPMQPNADTSLELRLADCSVQYDRFPYPLQHIQGLVTSHNGQWSFEKLESRDRQEATAAVTCAGQSQEAADGLELQLAFQGSNVALDENLRRALTPAVQKVWADLRPQGSVDFTANVVRHPTDKEAVIQVELRPHAQSVSVEPTFFPYRFEQIGGRALVSANHVELQQISARHGRSGFAGQGAWQATPDGGWQLALTGLNVDRVTADPEFVAALPPSVQRIIDRLKPSGTIDLLGTTLQFAKGPGAAQLASNWDIQLACHQTALRGDLPLDSLTGGVRLMGRSDGQTCFSYGELAIDSLIWNDAQLTNVRGPFWADNSNCLLGQGATAKLGQPPRPMTADAYGGTLHSDIRLQHDGNPIYHVDVSMGGVDLRRITSERLGGPKDITGTVSGKLSLDGAGRSTYALAGSGELHIVDANIYKLPVLVALLKVLSNRSPDTTAFDRCDASFHIHGEQIQFDRLNLLGDALSLYGRGEASFNRNLNLEFYSMVGPSGFTVPLLSSMAGQASKQMLQLKVDGPIDNPQIHREAFPAMNQMLQQIQAELQRGAPTGVVQSPAPAAAPPAQASSPWGPQIK
ncbi:MAG TPA: AsmA-like C-terminal region-containing protein [Lacipirellulaceae bacterium]|jgi:hypothetical protein